MGTSLYERYQQETGGGSRYARYQREQSARAAFADQGREGLPVPVDPNVPVSPGLGPSLARGGQPRTAWQEAGHALSGVVAEPALEGPVQAGPFLMGAAHAIPAVGKAVGQYLANPQDIPRVLETLDEGKAAREAATAGYAEQPLFGVGPSTNTIAAALRARLGQPETPTERAFGNVSMIATPLAAEMGVRAGLSRAATVASDAAAAGLRGPLTRDLALTDLPEPSAPVEPPPVESRPVTPPNPARHADMKAAAPVEAAPPVAREIQTEAPPFVGPAEDLTPLRRRFLAERAAQQEGGTVLPEGAPEMLGNTPPEVNTLVQAQGATAKESPSLEQAFRQAGLLTQEEAAALPEPALREYARRSRSAYAGMEDAVLGKENAETWRRANRVANSVGTGGEEDAARIAEAERVIQQMEDGFTPAQKSVVFGNALPHYANDEWAKDLLQSRTMGRGEPPIAPTPRASIDRGNPEAGTGKLPIVTGLAGAGAGAAVGATQDTDHPLRGALLGGLAGAAAGAMGGRAVEGMGKRGATAVLPDARPMVPKGEVPPLEGDLPQGPLRRPEANTVARLQLSEPDAERVRAIARGFQGPGHESWQVVRDKADQILGTRQAPIDFKRGSRADVLAAATVLRRNGERIGVLARQAKGLPADEAAPLQAEMTQLSQQSKRIFDSITSAKTEQARDLAANKILTGLTDVPDYWQYRAQQLAGRTLTDAENARIAQHLNNGERDQMLRYLGRLTARKPWERPLALWKAGLLTNPATHATNLASNITFAASEMASQPVAAGFDALMSLVTKQRTKAGPDLGMAAASLRGIAKGARMIPNELRGLPTGEPLATGQIPREVWYGNPVLSGLLNGPFRLLEASDRVFVQSAVEASISEQAKVLARAEGGSKAAQVARRAELASNPTPEMAARAAQDALVRTFKDQTSLGTLAKHVSDFAPGGVPIGQVVMPFARTPGAVATRVAESSPLGFVGGALLARKAFRALADGDAATAKLAQQQAAEVLGRASTGTALMIAGYQLYQKGFATGVSDPQDRKARTMGTLTGKPDDAFKIGGNWVEVNRLGPAGMLLSLGAAIAQAEQGASIGERASTGLASGARILTDQPFLQGVQNVSEALQDPANAGSRYLNRLATSVVPAGIAAVARATDPVQRDARTLGEQFQSRIPGLSQALPALPGPLGGDTQRLAPGAQQALSPARMTADRTATDPLVKELDRLGIDLGNTQPIRNLESRADWRSRATATGALLRRQLESVLSDSWYRGAPDEARKEVLERVIQRIRSASSRQQAGRLKSPP